MRVTEYHVKVNEVTELKDKICDLLGKSHDAENRRLLDEMLSLAGEIVILKECDFCGQLFEPECDTEDFCSYECREAQIAQDDATDAEIERQQFHAHGVEL
ncbi:MAG: hypothetical protein ABSC64_02315 [Candidatus Korobacteraceae bacterium]|jgi:hypothetical protein